MTGFMLIALLALPQPQTETTILANTEYVEDIIVLEHEGREVLFAATRGGVEAYDLDGGERLAHYTTADGLPGLHVRSLRKDENGQLRARLQARECTLLERGFSCSKAAPSPSPSPSLAGRISGARMTKRLDHGGLAIMATAGAGLWLRKGSTLRRLTPQQQICANHFMAMASFRGRLFFGGCFDGGLCSTEDGDHFEKHTGDFRMINDLESTPHGLFVAAAEGLYRTGDGTRFERVDAITQRGVNGLAFDGRSLWVTTPGALWRLRINGGPRDRQYWTPGGSRSLQAVAARGRSIWIATEDRGLLRKTRGGFDIFDRASGLPSSWMLDVSIGKNGRVYGASLRDGIVTVDRLGRMSSDGSAPDPWTLFVDASSDRVFVGSQGGASAGGLAFRGLPHPNVHSIATMKGRHYVATEGGTLVTSSRSRELRP